MIISYFVLVLKRLAQLPELTVEALLRFVALLDCMDQTKPKSSYLLQRKSTSLFLASKIALILKDTIILS
jgi:hypothetical protein